MKGMIFDVKRFAVHDGDGIRTTVFFKGCPLKCLWCHNPEGISRSPQLFFYEHKCLACGRCASVCARHRIENGMHVFDREGCVACGKCAQACPSEALLPQGREVKVNELLPLLLADRAFYETSGGGVTLSGGEALTQADFCAELLRALKENGIRTAVDTCGFVPRDSLEKVLPYTDLFLYDVKAVDPEVHRRCTGRDNALILSNLRFLVEAGKEIEVRVPVVPGYNDGEVPKILSLLDSLGIKRLKHLNYHDLARSKYRALGMEDTMPRVP